jgi:hypothetical protein
MHTLVVFSLNAAPFLIALAVYLLWIRPTIRNLPHIKEFYDDADSRWQKIGVWARTQWDILVAGAIMLVPNLPDIITQLQLVDMSAFIPTDRQKAWNSGLAVALIIFRAINIKKTS